MKLNILNNKIQESIRQSCIFPRNNNITYITL